MAENDRNADNQNHEHQAKHEHHEEDNQEVTSASEIDSESSDQESNSKIGGNLSGADISTPIWSGNRNGMQMKKTEDSSTEPSVWSMSGESCNCNQGMDHSAWSMPGGSQNQGMNNSVWSTPGGSQNLGMDNSVWSTPGGSQNLGMDNSAWSTPGGSQNLGMDNSAWSMPGGSQNLGMDNSAWSTPGGSQNLGMDNSAWSTPGGSQNLGMDNSVWSMPGGSQNQGMDNSVWSMPGGSQNQGMDNSAWSMPGGSQNQGMDNSAWDTAAGSQNLSSVPPSRIEPTATPAPAIWPVPEPTPPQTGWPIPEPTPTPTPPVWPTPIPPSWIEPPIWPGTSGITPPVQYRSQVRFLNASPNAGAVDMFIDGTMYAVNSRLGTMGIYAGVSDGFHTVTVRRSDGRRPVLFQNNIFFATGEKLTLVLIELENSDFDLMQVPATGCINMPYNTGCYRLANVSYPNTSFNLMMPGGEIVFNDIHYQEFTAYKQAMAGTYQFYVTSAVGIRPLQDIPIIVTRPSSNISIPNAPVAAFQTEIQAGKNYTTYLLANNWGSESIQALTVED